MARPLRIQFPGAWYHVMNRGARRALIYPDDRFRHTFLALLGDVHERYGLEFHAWCLMNNHYHLLVRTPEANLGRAMRHLDGVYAQRHNRLKNTDGPLFRGRYKAILVDSDAYLAQLSRYIHRNPVEAKLAEHSETWRWSSYNAYLGHAKTPSWLYTNDILALFGTRRSRYCYKGYVDLGVDEEIRAFYAKARLPPVLGGQQFYDNLKHYLDDIDDREMPERRHFQRRPEMAVIIEATAAAFCVNAIALTNKPHGQAKIARAIAMNLCRSPGGYPLKEIAHAFGLRSYSGVGMAIDRLQTKPERAEINAMVERLQRRLFDNV